MGKSKQKLKKKKVPIGYIRRKKRSKKQKLKRKTKSTKIGAKKQKEVKAWFPYIYVKSVSKTIKINRSIRSSSYRKALPSLVKIPLITPRLFYKLQVKPALSSSKPFRLPRAVIIKKKMVPTVFLQTKLSIKGSPVLPKLFSLRKRRVRINYLLKSPVYSQKVTKIPKIRIVEKKAVIKVLNFDTNLKKVEGFSLGKYVSMEVRKMEKEGLLGVLLNIRGILPRGSSENFDKPVFIILGEDNIKWRYPIMYLLSELYKEIKGEKPTPTMRYLNELNKEAKKVDSTVEPYLIVNFSSWGKIEALDAKEKTIESLKTFLEKISGRIETAYLQGLGFFLIIVESGKVKEVEKCLENVKARGVSIVTMQPEVGYFINRYEALTYSLLGMEKIESEVKILDFFEDLKRYEDCLRKTVNIMSPFVKQSENEAHQYPLKCAVFQYLIEQEIEKSNKIEDTYMFISELLDKKISVEKSCPALPRVIPDITYESDDIKAYIEIETLVGTGDPIKKIDKTVEKYKDTEMDKKLKLNGHELWIVLRPLSALLHYEQLKHREKVYKILYTESPVKFKVLICKKDRWELISLESFAEKIRSALETTENIRNI